MTATEHTNDGYHIDSDGDFFDVNILALFNHWAPYGLHWARVRVASGVAQSPNLFNILQSVVRLVICYKRLLTNSY